MISKLQKSLTDIRCSHAARALEEILHQSNANDDSNAEFLVKLLDCEIYHRYLRNAAIEVSIIVIRIVSSYNTVGLSCLVIKT